MKRYYGNVSIVDFFRYYSNGRLNLPLESLNGMMFMLPYDGVYSYLVPSTLTPEANSGVFRFALNGTGTNHYDAIFTFRHEDGRGSFNVSVDGTVGSSTVSEEAFLYFDGKYTVGGENAYIFEGNTAPQPTVWTTNPSYWEPFININARAFNFGGLIDRLASGLSITSIPAPILSGYFVDLVNIKVCAATRNHLMPYITTAPTTPPSPTLAVDISPIFYDTLNYPTVRHIDPKPEFSIEVGVDGERVIQPSDTPLMKLGDVFTDIYGNKWMSCRYTEFTGLRTSLATYPLDGCTDVLVDTDTYTIFKKGVEAVNGYRQGVIHAQVKPDQYVLVKLDR
jgi:hypothetical protein